MFSTLLYSLFLFYQLIFLGGSVQYNSKVHEINELVKLGLYKESYWKVQRIQQEHIFNNPQITDIAYVLSLKLPVGKIPMSNMDGQLTKSEKGILLGRKFDFLHAKAYFKAGILEDSSNDSLIKLFEIYAHLNQGHPRFPSSSPKHLAESTHLKAKMDPKDAILVLDLMKKKEKLLNY